MKIPLPRESARKLLMEGSLFFADMEHYGIRVDTDYINRTVDKLQQEIKERADELYKDEVWRTWKKVYKAKAKISSYQQLAGVIFGALKHPCTALTATGKPKADEETLKQVDLPFVRNYFARQKRIKLLTTYLLNYQREQVNGYIHPSFNFNPTSYRSGCSDPNVQNVPNRGALAKIVRDCFIPRKGRVLVEIDYAQLEVRVAACYHKDPTMLSYIQDPTTCMHRDTAMELFFLTRDQVEKKTTRDWAKNRFVFPSFYGSVFFQTAPNLWKGVESGTKLPDGTLIIDHLKKHGIKELGEKFSDWSKGRIVTKPGTFMEHVRQVERKMWYQRFPEYTAWRDKWWRDYCRKGWFRSLTGFVIHGVHKRNEILNYPVQGSAFHCLLWSGIQANKELRKRKFKSRIINEIHDCMVLDVPVGEVQDVLFLMKDIMVRQCMENYPWLIVPLEVEMEVTPEGGTWYDKKQWVEKNGTWQLAA